MQIPKQVRDFALQHRISVGRDEFSYFIKENGKVVDTTSSKNPTVPNAMAMLRRYMKRKNNPGHSHEAVELQLYADNTREINNQKDSILKNLQKKMDKGLYDRILAAKLWKYLMDNAAKMYTKEFGTPGSKIFSVAVRNEAAKIMEDEYFDMLKNGEYRRNPAKRKVKRKTAKKKSRKINPAGFVIRAHKKAADPFMHFNGHKFSSEIKPKIFKSSTDALKKSSELISQWSVLRKYIVEVAPWSHFPKR